MYNDNGAPIRTYLVRVQTKYFDHSYKLAIAQSTRVNGALDHCVCGSFCLCKPLALLALGQWLDQEGKDCLRSKCIQMLWPGVWDRGGRQAITHAAEACA